MQREKWACVFVLLVYARGNDHTHEPDVNGVFVAGVFDDIGGDVAKRTGKRDEFLVGRMEKFCSEKRWTKGGQGREMDGDLHAKIDDDTITVGVVGMVEDVLGSVK